MKSVIVAIRDAFVLVAFATLAVLRPPIMVEAAWAQETPCEMATRHSDEACEAAQDAMDYADTLDKDDEDYEEARDTALAFFELCLDRLGDQIHFCRPPS